MTESIQRIIGRGALAGTHMESLDQTIKVLEANVRGWNRCPTPFTWGGKRKARRDRARIRRQGYRPRGSSAVAPLSLRQSRMAHEVAASCQL
jgi:hypothetical protein